MASLTIRKLDDDTKTRLRLSAAAKGVSMEEEARLLIAAAVHPALSAASAISAAEIISRAKALPKEEPLDLRYKTMSQKELSDAMWGEFDGV
jgi:phosphopantothenoylcysteine decarboxylase / phosphopantothenate---cysteine ligase